MTTTTPATIARHSAMPPPVRLSARHRRGVYAGLFVLWLTGALWLVFHYFLQRPGAFGSEPHVLESWWLRLHGLAMMVALVAAGTVVVHHAGRAWQLGRNRLAGALLSGILLWLAVTGYALYYFSGDDTRTWLPWLHWLPGLALPLAVALHVRHGQRRRQHRTAADSPPSPVRHLPTRPRALPQESPTSLR
jgi:hypothetical protein